LWIRPLIRPVDHPEHVTLAAIVEPLPETLTCFRRQFGRGDADRAKALFLRSVFQRFGQS
jgi:hypothetical protein